MATNMAQFGSVWTRPRRPTPHRLSRGQIVAEALALLDAEGYEALSMRRLGHRLNAGATSLYTHVANKDELLELVVDEAFGEIAVPGDPTAQTWRAEALTLAGEVRGLLLRRPWILTVLSSAGLAHLGPNMLRMSEGMFEIFAAAGVDDDNADRVANAVFAYVIGATTTEASVMTMVARSGLTEQEWLQRILATAEAVSRPFPRVHRRYAEHRRAGTETSRDALFIDEVEMILDGLESRRQQQASTSR